VLGRLPQGPGKAFNHQALQASVKKEQVCFEVAITYLNPVFVANEQEITSQFKDEMFHLGDQCFLQIAFIVIFGETQEFEDIIRLK
jgi:hypothetical protein